MNIILFDGFCNLCDSSVRFLRKYDKKNNLHFVAQQSKEGKEIMQKFHVHDENQSVVFIKDTKVYDQSDAVIEACAMLTGWPRLIKYGNRLPLRFRNWVYQLIARNRYRLFGKKDSCTLPSNE